MALEGVLAAVFALAQGARKVLLHRVMQLDMPLEIAIVLEGLVAQLARVDILSLAAHHSVIGSIESQHIQHHGLDGGFANTC